MESKFDNWLSLNQKLLRKILLVLDAVIFIQITLLTFNAFGEKREKQSPFLGRYRVLKITKDKRQIIYIAGIYKGGLESDLKNYDSRDTFLLQEKALQFQKIQNEIIWHNEVIEAYKYKDTVEVVYPE